MGAPRSRGPQTWLLQTPGGTLPRRASSTGSLRPHRPGRPLSVQLWECLGWALPSMHRAFTRIRQLLELLLQSATALHVSFQHQHLRSAVSVIVKNPGCRLAANTQKPGSIDCPRTSRPAGKPGRGHEKLGAAFILRDCKIFWGCNPKKQHTPAAVNLIHLSKSSHQALKRKFFLASGPVTAVLCSTGLESRARPD